MSQYNQSPNSYSQPPRPAYTGSAFPPQQPAQPQYPVHQPQPQPQQPQQPGTTSHESAFAANRHPYTATQQPPMQATPAVPAPAPATPRLPLNVAATASFEEKKGEALRVAREFFRSVPDWVTFFREVLGVEGIVARLFPQADEYARFEQSDEFGELQLLIVKLRERTNVQNESKEPTRVITVRLPKSLHESLRVEAHSRRTSMNKLCISKLLQVIDDSMIPND